MTSPDPAPTCVALRALYLGDLITGLPALSMLRSALPGHRIMLAAPVTVGTLAVRAGVVDTLLPSLELAPLAAPPDIDVAVDLHGNGPASRDLLAVHRPRRLIAYADARLPWRQDEHEVTRWCRLIADAFDIPAPWPGVRGLLPVPAVPGDGTAGSVVIHPGAKSAARRWPADRFAAVARALTAAGQLVVVTGGPDEEALAERIAADAGVQVRLGLSLDELFRMVAAARLVICGDTGIGHVAGAFGTPSVHLFGPVPPSEWGPPADGPHTVLYHGPAGYRGDPHADVPDPALLKIAVNEVLDAACARGERTPMPVLLDTAGIPTASPAPSSSDVDRPLNQRVTVVLLTYNCAHRLQRILDETLALGVPVIAVDNASHDETAAVLAERERVQLIRSPLNIGAAGRNVGAAAARTPYVAFCDDDGWYERGGLALACDLLDQHPSVGLINARILVGPQQDLDPISAEMAASPLALEDGLPGVPILGFMAGAVVVRTEAFRDVGGYDVRFFMGGEEETLALPLARSGWHLRYVPEVVAHHYPSMSNAGSLRSYGMSNTILNAWLHRPVGSALRWTAFVLADTPKTSNYVRGVVRTVRNLPWVLRERRPLTPDLDAQLRHLDRRRYAARRPFLTFRDWRPSDAAVSP